MTLEHIWCCECGAETKCEPEQLRAGSVFQCPSCMEVWGAVRPKQGGGVKWIHVRPDEVEFHDLLGKRYFAEVEEERLLELADQKYEAQMMDLDPDWRPAGT